MSGGACRGVHKGGARARDTSSMHEQERGRGRRAARRAQSSHRSYPRSARRVPCADHEARAPRATRRARSAAPRAARRPRKRHARKRAPRARKRRTRIVSAGGITRRDVASIETTFLCRLPAHARQAASDAAHALARSEPLYQCLRRAGGRRTGVGALGTRPRTHGMTRCERGYVYARGVRSLSAHLDDTILGLRTADGARENEIDINFVRMSTTLAFGGRSGTYPGRSAQEVAIFAPISTSSAGLARL